MKKGRSRAQLKRKKEMGSTRDYFARRKVGKKNQIHWNERRKVSLKLVQEVPGQETSQLSKRQKEEQSYIHLVSPSHNPQPPSILVWTAPGGWTETREPSSLGHGGGCNLQ